MWALAAGRRPCAGRLFANPQRTSCTNSLRTKPKRDIEGKAHKLRKSIAHKAAQGSGAAIGVAGYRPEWGRASRCKCRRKSGRKWVVSVVEVLKDFRRPAHVFRGLKQRGVPLGPRRFIH